MEITSPAKVGSLAHIVACPPASYMGATPQKTVLGWLPNVELRTSLVEHNLKKQGWVPRMSCHSSWKAIFRNTQKILNNMHSTTNSDRFPQTSVCAKCHRIRRCTVHRVRLPQCPGDPKAVLCETCTTILLPRTSEWAGWLGLQVCDLIRMITIHHSSLEVTADEGLSSSWFCDRFWADFANKKGLLVVDRKVFGHHTRQVCMIPLKQTGVDIFTSVGEWCFKSPALYYTDKAVWSIDPGRYYACRVGSAPVLLDVLLKDVLQAYAVWTSHGCLVAHKECILNTARTRAHEILSKYAPRYLRGRVLHEEVCSLMRCLCLRGSVWSVPCTEEFDRRSRADATLKAFAPNKSAEVNPTGWRVYRRLVLVYSSRAQ